MISMLSFNSRWGWKRIILLIIVFLVLTKFSHAQTQPNPLTQITPIGINLDVFFTSCIVLIFFLYLIATKKGKHILFIINILFFALVLYLIIIYKPPITPSINNFVVGILTGFGVFSVGKSLQLMKKQLIRLGYLIIESVFIVPFIEEIIFRFGIITLMFNNSLIGLLVSIFLWCIIHYFAETLIRPTKYYKTKHSLVSETESNGREHSNTIRNVKINT